MGEAKRRRAIHADDEATPLSLADRIFAQCGSRADAMHLGRSFTFLHKAISLAQRFNLDLDVVHACHELKQSKPSSLVAALPLCRLPYPRMWVEWTGTVKWRCGVLIESLNGNPTTGLITHVYDGGDCPVINPWATYFDWRTDGDVSALPRKLQVASCRQAASV